MSVNRLVTAYSAGPLLLDRQDVASLQFSIREERVCLAQRGNARLIDARDRVERLARLHAVLQTLCRTVLGGYRLRRRRSSPAPSDALAGGSES